jgi:Asp-tRNA(Asn)/Glu-tRNA(Gln) amidotransferase A subunit family amidase
MSEAHPMPDLRHAGPAGLNLLTASEAAAKIAAGEITSEALVRDCIERVRARETVVHAWAHLDHDQALFEARARDCTPRKGVLHGVPVGVKDVLDTLDMPTEYGSILYRGHRPLTDSACVNALRAAGAVIMGKTATTEFAAPYPIATRNPHDLTRTPGVSSSGSAAAVADFQVPLALGTQTGGSVIRPATLCGVFGYKASLDGLNRGNIRNLKPTLDTLGLFARSVADLALLRAAITAAPAAPTDLDRPPRIGVCRTPFWSAAASETINAIESAASALARAGATVGEAELPAPFRTLPASFRVITQYETVRGMADEAERGFNTLNPWSRDAITAGRQWSDDDYERAKAEATRCRGLLAEALAPFDAFLTPSDRGEAPPDLRSIHDSPFNASWTLMHVPCVTIPAYVGPNNMPVGVQIVGPHQADDRTLAVAGWAARVLMG